LWIAEVVGAFIVDALLEHHLLVAVTYDRLIVLLEPSIAPHVTCPLELDGATGGLLRLPLVDLPGVVSISEL
jgi:hypothetical protein